MLKRTGTLRARINLYRSSRNRTSEAVGIHRPELSGIAKSSSHAAGGGGVDPKTVQARLGHESLNTTLNIYAEEVGENDRKAADFMGKLLE